MNSTDFLLEVGSEEIPAGYIQGALANLKRGIEEYFQAVGIDYDPASIQTFATPRRLAVRISSVALLQESRSEMKLGPNLKIAFDAEGQPTPAAAGFARSVGADVKDLQKIETDKGERLGYEVMVGGAATRDLLLEKQWLRDLVVRLGFPKVMRWIPGDDLTYARPIRWLCCLLGEEVIPLTLSHLIAGRTSRGHRTLSSPMVEIPSATGYEKCMTDAHVLVRVEERLERIRREAAEMATQAGGVLHQDEGLLAEVNQLLEHPQPVLGSFDEKMVQELPREIITTALRAHQRYFCVEDSEGNLLPHFITFRDGGSQGLDNVREGNERVLRARLEDALFYWNEDLGLGSEGKLQQLERIVWLEGYGSIADKSRRMAHLAQALARELQIQVDPDRLRRACLMCKSDLATEMIRDGKEFTKLQGIMGRYYALKAGEDPVVADAIAEHHYPRFASDRLPEGELAILLGLADRLDSMAGCVLAGFAPTGGQDPYALRRQALAVLRILVERQWKLDLEEWTRIALKPYEADATASHEAEGNIVRIFWGRLETLLADLPGEIVRAVLSVSTLDPFENRKAARALAEMVGSESFSKLREGAKRCRNILFKENRLAEEQVEDVDRAHRLRQEAQRRWQDWIAQQSGGVDSSFDPGLFDEKAEKDLLECVRESVPALAAALTEANHAAIFAILANFGNPISSYFDEVLVNSKDEAIRANRLAFLENIHYLFARFADLTRLGKELDSRV